MKSWRATKPSRNCGWRNDRFPAEIAAWAAGLPNLAAQWVDANADDGAADVLAAYMAKVRERGLTPRIDWSAR